MKYCLFAVVDQPTKNLPGPKNFSPTHVFQYQNFFFHSFSDIETSIMEFENEVLFSYTHVN
jgi:hypothetical protein